MASGIRFVLLLSAFGTNLLGVFLFVRWIVQTDIFFGHYTGPPVLLKLGAVFMGLGVLLAIAWYATAFAGWARAPEAVDPPARKWPGIVAGVALLPLAGLSGFGVCVALYPYFNDDGRGAEIYKSAEQKERDRVAIWIEDLDSPEARIRTDAIILLGGAGQAAADAVPALREALDDPDSMARVYAADALLKITNDPGEVVPALIDVLESDASTDQARGNAVYHLYAIGPPARDALPVLRDLAQNAESESLRNNAADAVGRIEN